MITPLDRKAEEGKLILELIHWLDENRPAPDPYEYMFTVHNRLSLTPELAIYLIPKSAKSSIEALGGITIQMPAQMDVLDGIKYLWDQMRLRDMDLRDFIPKESPSH